ncbi:MAG: hypothetical protein DCC71_18120 [Proteobacteria bacterium]|nr:MAG: hypothetical protein DCC71_18120 [Pseudomonadota bacterium]
MRPALAAAALLALATPVRADWISYGNGWGSKWDDPVHGTPATVTWGFVDDGTIVDPGFYLAAEVSGGSAVGALRATVDAAHGAGAFDAAIQNAFDTWHAVSGITFVGPVAGGNAPLMGSVTSPDIRIGAFAAVPSSGFSWVGAVGFGPPGDDLFFPDAVAGDVAFNLSVPHEIWPGAEGAPAVPFTNDLEGLMLHELGHAAMGLGHPADGAPEVMYVGAGCCAVVNREPSPDDIAGAQSVYGASSIPACANDIDDDGDGLYDGLDPGCANASDASERDPALPCDDGADDDGDGRADHDPATLADPAAGRGDPGCKDPARPREDPQCSNGADDDGKPGTDFDGGVSVNGGPGDPNGPDPHCVGKPWRDDEKAPPGCGLGAELALLLPLAARVRRRAPI